MVAWVFRRPITIVLWGLLVPTVPPLRFFLSAHQSIGLPQPLKLFGTDEQKKKWLTLISKGAKSAFALTEVAVGSDPAKMSTTAVPTEDGKHYIINGEKLWCTNGLIADVLVVMAQTPAIKRPDGREKKQITAFIVDAHSEGVQKIHRCDFMGIRGIQNGVIRFKDVKVPAENIIWGLGKGLRLALTTLNTGRLTIPGAATAASKFCLQVVREWGKERVQWGRPIGEHEASADLMSKVAASSYAIEAITYLTSGWVDNNQFDVRLEAAFAKIFTTEVCWRVIDSTLQLRGGRGYETSESLRGRGEKGYPLERMMRDFRINTIIEGTTTILKLFVAREAFDKHLSIAGALFTKAPVTEKLKTLFIKIPAFYLLWYPKQWLSLPDFLCPEFYQGWTGKQHLFIKKYSKKLARTIFHAMLIYGPNLDKRQMTIMRLMNAGMFLFGAAAVLTRFETHKKQGSLQTGEELLAKYAATGLSNRTTEMFERLKLRRRDSKSVKMSKAIMKGDYEWMETGVLLGKL
jgi:alkylation response protein AidB-like acyl-CoA dehydrogenase